MAKKRKPLKLLFITDPLPHFDPIAETTIYMMREAQRRGHHIYSTLPQKINAQGTRVYGPVEKIQTSPKKGPQWYRVVGQTQKEFKFFDAILLRKDPPFTLEYLHHLYLLELLSDEVYCMNHPRGIMIASEKIFPIPFKDKVPKTLVSADQDELLKFIQKNPKGCIIKPLQAAGGQGVFYIRNPLSDNIRVILESATHGYTQHVVAQAYLPEIKKGDKRILLLGYKAVGAFLRKAAQGEHRANLHAGGKAYPSKITTKDQEIIDQLQATLLDLGLEFVGLDIIGNSLIEVNVTSPMGIHEINQTGQTQCERQVLDYIEERVKDFL